VLSDFGRKLQDALAEELESMQEELMASDERRDRVYRATRMIFKNVAQILFRTRTGQGDDVPKLSETTASELHSILSSVNGQEASQKKREGNLNVAIEKFTETKLLSLFFSTGRLARLSDCQPCSDEEYLMACLGFAQELTRYSTGRAIVGDTDSIGLCRDLCNDLNVKMLEFDFRNGPLRRKYDGLKYALKKLEEIGYELSLLQGGEEVEEKTDENKTKRRRVETPISPPIPSESQKDDTCSTPLLHTADFDEIRQRLDTYDKLREQVIKDCRDVQKAAKQAIFAVHRSKLSDADRLISQACDAALPIWEKAVRDNENLRYGSFSNALEELAEAAMTLHWVRTRTVLSKQDASTALGLELNTTEYVGALSDLTGEMGRIAVQRATVRDETAVKETHMALVIISAAMMQLNTGGKFTKKAEAVSGTLKKVEDIVYEIALVRRGGRAGRQREAEPVLTED
jgi:predicted translin family RNA/ssDNA-binding protein